MIVPVLAGAYAEWMLSGTVMEGRGHPLFWAILVAVLAAAWWRQHWRSKMALALGWVNGLSDEELIRESSA